MNTDRFVRFWICFVIFFGFVMPFLSTFFSYSSEESTGFNDYARIVGLDYKAELVDEPGNGGNVVITEQITYDVHAASSSNLFWELWRDLPEDYVDGLKVDYTVNYVKQLNDDGTEIKKVLNYIGMIVTIRVVCTVLIIGIIVRVHIVKALLSMRLYSFMSMVFTEIK